MTKPLSNDLRLRAVEAVVAGMSCRAVVDRFRLSPSTVVKWMRLWRETRVATGARYGSRSTSRCSECQKPSMAHKEKYPPQSETE